MTTWDAAHIAQVRRKAAEGDGLGPFWKTMMLSALDQLAAAKPREPNEAMLNAARDWSLKKNGIGLGNDQATGCWQAMWDASNTKARGEQTSAAIGGGET